MPQIGTGPPRISGDNAILDGHVNRAQRDQASPRSDLRHAIFAPPDSTAASHLRSCLFFFSIYIVRERCRKCSYLRAKIQILINSRLFAVLASASCVRVSGTLNFLIPELEKK